MGRGIGRSLFIHALGRAKELGFRELEIESDPNAEGFYLRLGARRVSTLVRVVAGQSREVPLLVYMIPPL
jgi:GNAT superfamily N-acetyltransferase